MIRALRRLNQPVAESQLGMALAVAALALALLLWAVMWQSDVIAYQRNVIRTLVNSQYGG